MKAIELTAFEGFQSLRLAEVERPQPGLGEILIKVRAAGINFAELEQTRGAYPFSKPLPGVMGFEAAGEVVEVGPGVNAFRTGDRVVAPAASGGYAEYTTASADLALPIPEGITFAEATSIIIQGLSAYALLKLAAKPLPHETVLIQAAAGGVGSYLVQIAKSMRVGRIIALAGSSEKLDFVQHLGADVAIDYARPHWDRLVREQTGGKGVDVVLEMASGEVGKTSFGLLAPFGRFVLFGAKNVEDTLSPAQVQQLIHHNQTIAGFNFPSLKREDVGACVPELLAMIADGSVKPFANTEFPLAQARQAFEAISNRQTIGKVVLVP